MGNSAVKDGKRELKNQANTDYSAVKGKEEVEEPIPDPKRRNSAESIASEDLQDAPGAGDQAEIERDDAADADDQTAVSEVSPAHGRQPATNTDSTSDVGELPHSTEENATPSQDADGGPARYKWMPEAPPEKETNAKEFYLEPQLGLLAQLQQINGRIVKEDDVQEKTVDSWGIANVVPEGDEEAMEAEDEEQNLFDTCRRREKLKPTEQTFLLGRYLIVKRLGAVPCGSLYIVGHKRTGKLYTLKMISKWTAKEEWRDAYAERLRSQEVFLRELDVAFVPKYTFCFENPGIFFLCTERVSAVSLATVLDKNEKLSETQTRHIIAELVVIVNRLHEHSIVHRDIQPSTIMMEKTGHIYLKDLSHAARLTQKSKKRSDMAGEIGYRAPEMLRGLSYGFAVDWWAVGVVLHLLIFGFHPFSRAKSSPTAALRLQAPDEAIKRAKTEDITLPEGGSQSVRHLIQRLLDDQPKKRIAGGSRAGAKEIQVHPFFSGVNWLKTEARQIEPKFCPDLPEERDLKQTMYQSAETLLSEAEPE